MIFLLFCQLPAKNKKRRRAPFFVEEFRVARYALRDFAARSCHKTSKGLAINKEE